MRQHRLHRKIEYFVTAWWLTGAERAEAIRDLLALSHAAICRLASEFHVVSNPNTADNVKRFGFPTEAEAIAFREGVEFVNDSSIEVQGVEEIDDQWWCILIDDDASGAPR